MAASSSNVQPEYLRNTNSLPPTNPTSSAISYANKVAGLFVHRDIILEIYFNFPVAS